MQFTSTFPSHSKPRTDERDTETQDFKRQDPIHKGRQVRDEKCCCAGMRKEGGFSAAQRTRRSTRQTPWLCRLQASPIPKELEEVIAIGVCNTSRQHGERERGRRGERQLPSAKSC